MLKEFYLFLDFFLPKYIDEQVDIAMLFRARTIIAFEILGVLTNLILFTGVNILGAPLYIQIGVLCNIVVFLTLIIFLKTRTQNYQTAFDLGIYLQTFIFYLAIYTSALFSHGLGFFSLIWLFPLLLVTAFVFKPYLAALFFCLNFIAIVILGINLYHNFFIPIETPSIFKELFLLYFILVVTTSSIMSYLFVQLDDHLKKEIRKQKNQILDNTKFQSLQQMASNLAHDINNPLFTIQGKLHQVRNLFSQDQLDLGKCDQITEDVESTILRLSQIVKGISTFARQSHQDQMVSVRVDELIRGAVFLSSDRIVQLGINFDLRVDSAVRIICYPSYISQVLINLLNNAIDALDNSELKIIQVEVLATKKWIEIHIKDSGPGVDLDIQSKIFDSFFTTKKYGKRVGVGLSISKGLIETHEGMLEYQRIGEMTDFIVYLPNYE